MTGLAVRHSAPIKPIPKWLPCPNVECNHPTALSCRFVGSAKPDHNGIVNAYMCCDACNVRGPIGWGESASKAADDAASRWNNAFVRITP